MASCAVKRLTAALRPAGEVCSGRVLLLALIAACLLACTSPDVVIAQLQGVWATSPMVQANGVSMQMPLARPVSRKSKLSLSIDTRWANNYGYRPIEVTVMSPKPATADRLFTIRLHINGWGWQTGSLSVEQDFELPMGQTSVRTTIACPLYKMEQQYVWWEVWVDGVKDDDLSMEKTAAMSTMNAAISPTAGSGVSCLVVSPVSRQRTLTAPSSMEFEVLSLAIPQFPRHWLGYTGFDVVSLSFAELVVIAESNPQAFEALRRWVRTGGQLWVSELSEQFEELPEISKLFQLAETRSEVAADAAVEKADGNTEDMAKPGWKPVRFLRGNPEGQVVTFLNLNTNETRVARDPNEISRLQSDPNFVVTGQQFNADQNRPRRRWPADSGRWFVEQRFGLGTVRAFRNVKDTAPGSQWWRISGTDPRLKAALEAAAAWGIDPTALGTMGAMPAATDGEQPELPPPMAMALRSTRRWEARHGMTPDDANLDFPKLLVPGVGLAPVTEFRVLITLFVLLIGPGNYWILKRFNRLHLLVLTVPLAALLTTTGLFAYAIISDGFGTKVRAHSFTTLDQRSGEASCWTRLSFYAGVAPGRGLSLPSDVAVYPIIPGWNESAVDANVGASRELLWEANEAKLTRGWLQSRTPTQFLTIRSRKSPHMLELLAANGKMRATNKLGTRIQFVLAVDDEGNLFSGENVPVQARLNLSPIARSEAIRRMRELIMANEPQAPPELAGGDSEFQILQRRQQRRAYRRFGLQYGEERLGTNLVSEAISQLAGLDGQPALELPPRSYVAITDTGPEVEIGMSGASEDASFHVVVGQW